MADSTLLTLPVVAIVILMISWCDAAKASLFVLGSKFAVQSSNSPDSFTEIATSTPGNQLLDLGAVNLNILIVPNRLRGKNHLEITPL